MEFIRWISRVYNIHKRWLLVVTVILTLFHLLCIGLAVKEYIPDGASIGSVIWDFHADCILLSEPFIRRTIDQVIAQMLMWLTICIWIYAAPRFARGHEELKGYLFEITGVKDNNQEIKGFIEEARELWDQQELWACTIPQICKKERPGISITKMCYMLGWVAMLVLTYLIPVRQNYIPLRQPFSIYWLQALLTLIFGVVSVGICMFSWWCCMEYAFFLSRVSALKSLTVPYGYTYYVKKRKRNNGFWTELWKANNERTAKDY